MTGSTASIIVLDVEATGKEKSRDQIIEVALQLGLDPLAECIGWRIKPTVAIHPEAQAVHGITAEMLAGCPSFEQVAPRVVQLLAGADVIVGYNVAFDLDMLAAELERAKLPPLDLSSKQVIDVLRLWHHVEPRTLAAAHEKFLGEPLTNAHAAGADVPATARVLTAMLERFGLADRAWTELAAIANPFAGRDKWIGSSHHVQWDGGVAILAFGKYRGVPLDQVDSGFLSWALGKDFPAHVKDIFRAALRMKGESLAAWLVATYPRAQQEAA